MSVLGDPFARFGIDHLSPNNLNCYAEQPSRWALTYLFGHRDEGNAKMWRGSAVEAGLDHYLFKRDLDAALEAAYDFFELKAVGLADDETEAQWKLIKPTLEQAAIAVAGLPEPTARQVDVEHWFEGIEVPIHGRLDYLWPEFGLELKTTTRLPSEISGAHARASSLYATAKARPWKLLYVTPKRFEIIPLEDVGHHMRQLEVCARCVRRLLARHTDKHDIASMFVPDFDHYRWDSEAARSAAAQIWTS